MSETDQPRPARNQSGRWLVVALFVLAGATVLAFYKTSYKIDPAPPETTWGRPGMTIRVMALDAGEFTNQAPLIERIKSLSADVIFLRHISGTMVDSLAAEVGMQQNGRPQVYYPAQNIEGPGTEQGNAILSKLPLYEGRSVPNKGGSFGVWAVAVVEGHKFMLASIALSPTPDKETKMLEKAWLELRSPPMIVGGDVAGASLTNSNVVTKNILLLGGWGIDPASIKGEVVGCR